MFNFRAYFWNSDVYINEKYRFDSNEILTAFLNDSQWKYLDSDNYIYRLKSLKQQLIVSPDMDYQFYKNYNSTVYKTMDLLDYLNNMIVNLPPYNKILGISIIKLDDILNGYKYFFEDGMDYDDYTYGQFNEDTVNEYGMGEKDDVGNYSMRLYKFQLFPPEQIDMEDDDIRHLLHDLNRTISGFIDMYIGFVKAFIQVHQVYESFLIKHYHQRNSFPTAAESAEHFENFNNANSKNFRKIKCKMESFGYKALRGVSGEMILCEEIGFNDLGSFLYYDFFNGIKQNYVPNQCHNCGKYFLIKGKWYYTYCDKPLADDPDKTCRDVGSKRSYDNKCKTDPVWQTYNRAYKAHYARYMKKKMTLSEFEKWSRFASEIRDKALAGEIEFDKYYADIRK